MKTNAKSTQVMQIRLWSRKHYNIPKKSGFHTNIYDGLIIHAGTKRKLWVHSPADLLQAIETMYWDGERK